MKLTSKSFNVFTVYVSTEIHVNMVHQIPNACGRTFTLSLPCVHAYICIVRCMNIAYVYRYIYMHYISLKEEGIVSM